MSATNEPQGFTSPYGIEKTADGAHCAGAPCSARVSDRAQDAMRLMTVFVESGLPIQCGELRRKIIVPYFGADVDAELSRLFASPNR